MAIQNAINNMLGSVGTVAAIGTHLAKEKEANELTKAQNDVKRIEAEKEANAAKNALKEKTENIIYDMSNEGKDDLVLARPGETPEQAEARGVDEYLAEKSDIAESKVQEESMKVKYPGKSKRVLAARIAAISAQDEINTMRDLRFDLDIATKKIEALGGKK